MIVWRNRIAWRDVAYLVKPWPDAAHVPSIGVEWTEHRKAGKVRAQLTQ